jgi:hypothetical protein
MSEEFPDKPKGMHWRTYERLRRVHDVAEERSTIGLTSFVERLGHRFRRTERRALKQARFAFKKKQFVFNAGCCKDVKSKSKSKLTALRSSKTRSARRRPQHLC